MPDTFTAATWNVLHSVAAPEQVPTLRKVLDRQTSVILLQEMSEPGILDVFRDAGLRVFRHRPQYAVAWDPETWVEAHSEGVRLSDHGYFRKGGKSRIFSEAASVILCDREGRSLEALSYHTPAGVQRGGPSTAVPNRVQALRESMATLGTRAKARHARAALYGGDDNVDEARGSGWDFMLRAATGLRQVRAPEGTHGKRRIDDFRVAGLRPVGKGWVLSAPSDHDVFGCRFRWT